MPHESRREIKHLDPRSPLVINTHELGRRPGSMRTMVSTLPAPKDLSVELIGVREGADLELDLRLESVMEGVLVTGTARAVLIGECARCLEPLTSDLEVDFQELYFYDPEDAGEGDHVLDGELLDLEPVVRDAVVLALPLSPVCRQDCPGLCAQCGIRLADAGPDHWHETADPRWSALQGLFEDNRNDQES